MKNYNVIWLLVDSVRNYRSGGDDRDKLRIMEKLDAQAEWVSFSTAVCSAPSTLMSLSSIMTSIPAVYLSSSFDRFYLDFEYFITLPDVLKDKGYDVNGAIYFRSGREVLNNLFEPLPRKYWPRDLKHTKKFWSNNDMNRILERFLRTNPIDPFFFYLHYNCRLDFNASEKIEWALSQIEDAGLLNNSIIVICSDHGYPDPSRGMGPGYFKKNKLNHDIILTDDNICIPIYLRYPGSKNLAVKTLVSALDIFPTILDILEIDVPEYHMNGKSLLPLIKNPDNMNFRKRMFRVDNRFSNQSLRATTIRGNDYKYAFYHDIGVDKEEFFYIHNDQFEKNNLVNSNDEEVQNQLNIFRKTFQDSEKELLSFRSEYLFVKILKKYLTDLKKATSIMITDSCSPVFMTILISMIRKANKSIMIYLIQIGQNEDYHDESIQVLRFETNSWDSIHINQLEEMLPKERIDIVFALYNNNNTDIQNDNSLKKFLKQVHAKKKVYLDYNMDSKKNMLIMNMWKRFKLTWPYIKYEPWYLIGYVFIKIRIILTHNNFRKK